MQIYKLRLVMGKVANYDQNGKLKNHTITAKYGEMELENILMAQNWLSIGACEISCVESYNHPDLTNMPEVVKAINERIKLVTKQVTKPKSEVELLKEQVEKANEQNALIAEQNKTMSERLERLEKSSDPEKENRKALFLEAKELGLTPQKNILTDDLKKLVENAKK